MFSVIFIIIHTTLLPVLDYLSDHASAHDCLIGHQLVDAVPHALIAMLVPLTSIAVAQRQQVPRRIVIAEARGSANYVLAPKAGFCARRALASKQMLNRSFVADED